MSMPNKSQANYCYLDAAGTILAAVKDNLSEELDSDYFKHRLDILHIGIRATLDDMQRVMNGEAQVRSSR